MNRRRPAMLIANAAILVVGIAGLELIFGNWLNPSRLSRILVPKSIQLQYSIADLYPTPHPVITYSRDRYGLRGTHAAPADIQLLTVGGSTTDQRMVGDGDTWQAVLQREFAAAGKPIVVGNAGIDGQSTFGHLQNFRWWFPAIPGLAPDYILFYVGLNDFCKDEDYRCDELTADPSGFSVRKCIREKSAVWSVIRMVRGTWDALFVHEIGHRPIDLAALAWADRPLKTDYGFMEPRLEAYAERLRMLADLTRGFGAQPIFVSQPSRKYRTTPLGIEGRGGVFVFDGQEINGADYGHMMTRLNGVTESVANEKGVLFVDLATRDDWEDADFYDFAHMTPRGAAKVGRRLHEALRGLPEFSP